MDYEKFGSVGKKNSSFSEKFESSNKSSSLTLQTVFFLITIVLLVGGFLLFCVLYLGLFGSHNPHSKYEYNTYPEEFNHHETIYLLDYKHKIINITSNTYQESSDLKKLSLVRKAIDQNIDTFYNHLKSFAKRIDKKASSNHQLERTYETFGGAYLNIPNDTFSRIRKDLNSYADELEVQIEQGGHMPSMDEVILKYRQITLSDFKIGVEMFKNQMEKDDFLGPMNHTREIFASATEKYTISLTTFHEGLFRMCLQTPYEFAEITNALKEESCKSSPEEALKCYQKLLMGNSSDKTKTVLNNFIAIAQIFQAQIKIDFADLYYGFLDIIHKHNLQLTEKQLNSMI